MDRRTYTSSVLLALVASLALALPALAKEGAEAMLDTPISRDAEPGSTIDAGWSVFSISGGQRDPIMGSPIYIRLVSVDGSTSTEAMGTETPPGSGHYSASIVVPAGGIGEVIVGLVGEACDADGCQRSDMIFPLTDDALVTGPAAIAPATSTPVGSQLVPIVALGVAFAVVGAVGATIIGRRRGLQVDPAGR